MTAADYHADPCERPSLSATTAKTLVGRSPQRAYREHPRLGGVPRSTCPAMDRGGLVHELVFDQPLSAEVLDFGDFRTKAAQQARDAAAAAGRTPILAKDLTPLQRMAAAVRAQAEEFGVPLDGQSEGVILWQDRDDRGRVVDCRSRLDHVAIDGVVTVVDLKTCDDAHPKALDRRIVNFGYDLQAAAYTRAVEQAAPDWRGRVRFLFLFAEDEEPWPVTPVYLDAAFLAVGLSKWRRAVNLWAECLEANRWPQYATAPVVLTPPQWAIRDEIEASPTIELSDHLEY